MLSEHKLPTFAIVSTDIRRDLVAPLRYFTRLRIVHLYRKTSYGDLASGELDANTLSYGNPLDLFLRLWQIGADIVQGVEPFSIRLLPYLYVILVVAWLQRKPLVIVTLENRPLAEKHGPLFSRLLQLFLQPVLGYARLIVYLNDGARRNVLSIGGYEGKLKRLMYGTWGVDLGEFTPRKDGREPEDQGDPVLLFVGRLHVEKGVFDLLDAFGLVNAQFPLAKLIFVGDGPARGALERIIADRGLAGWVNLAGTVKNRDLPPYFRAASVFVAPSITTRKWEEQVGMTNIQAMACGVPVVSTRSGAIPEYVPNSIAGILVAERNPQALAEAILRLLTQGNLRHQMGEAGRAYAIEHYDARANVEKAESILIRLPEDWRSVCN